MFTLPKERLFRRIAGVKGGGDDAAEDAARCAGSELTRDIAGMSGECAGCALTMVELSRAPSTASQSVSGSALGVEAEASNAGCVIAIHRSGPVDQTLATRRLSRSPTAQPC